MHFDPASIFGNIVSWIAAAVIAAIGWAVRLTNARITRLEENMVSKDDHKELRGLVVDKETFARYIDSAERSRGELRESLIKLSDKLDALKDLMVKCAQGWTLRDK